MRLPRKNVVRDSEGLEDLEEGCRWGMLVDWISTKNEMIDTSSHQPPTPESQQNLPPKNKNKHNNSN